jgi:hypothetical protein
MSPISASHFKALETVLMLVVPPHQFVISRAVV